MRVFHLIAMLSFVVAGCGEDAGVATPSDVDSAAEPSEALPEEGQPVGTAPIAAFRAARERLHDLGVDVQKIDDPMLGQDAYLVTLFPEHFGSDGHVVEEVWKYLEHVPNCVLQLDDTPINDRGLARVQGLANLIGLSLFNTKITNEGLTYIRGLRRFRLLKLKSTHISDAGLIHLEGMAGLTILYLSGPKITDAALIHCTPLKGLQALQLSATRITDTGLEQLKGLHSLKYLGLDNTRVSDAGMKHLTSLEHLVYLNLHGTDVSSALVTELKQALPDCKIVL